MEKVVWTKRNDVAYDDSELCDDDVESESAGLHPSGFGAFISLRFIDSSVSLLLFNKATTLDWQALMPVSCKHLPKGNEQGIGWWKMRRVASCLPSCDNHPSDLYRWCTCRSIPVNVFYIPYQRFNNRDHTGER
jgi:hypothetical protein